MLENKQIYSMTGYGRGASTLDSVNISAECKTLNSRFLEVTCKLPRIYAVLEIELRQLVQSYISRGRVELSVLRRIDPIASEQNAAQQISLMSGLQRKLTELECQYSSLGISIDNSQKFEIARQLIGSNTATTEEEILSESEIDAVKKTVRIALMQLQKQRGEEGLRLISDLSKRMTQLTNDVTELKYRASKMPALLKERVSERVKSALSSVIAVDEARLLQEVVLLTDKADVTEELVRLDSHLLLFRDTMDNAGLVGKKLDFVCQEIFRELNTLGGKAASAEIQSIVVNCKVELERMREQIQNLE